MNKTNPPILITLIILIIGCNNLSDESNRVYFKINPENRKILIPVQLNDSITSIMTFDSGAADGTFHLDSTFCSAHPRILSDLHPDIVGQSGSAWTKARTRASAYATAPKTKIGITNIEYSRMAVYDYKSYYKDSICDGLFGFPENDTLHVWELNFEFNYLEIHLAQEFEMPEGCFIVPLNRDENNRHMFMKLPMQIQFANGDTLMVHRMFKIDTGMPWDIVLLYNADEYVFFNEREDATWTRYLKSYYRHFDVRASIFENHQMDSLRIYLFDYPKNQTINYLAGQNFLKRFNVFFDLKNQQIGLQPIKNFQRVINPFGRRFHISTVVDSKGRFLVSEIGNYKSNYYRTAGFQIGDEIVAIDSVSYEHVTFEEQLDFYKRDSLVYDIIRKGTPLKIVVHVDKNEKQGD